MVKGRRVVQTVNIEGIKVIFQLFPSVYLEWID